MRVKNSIPDFRDGNWRPEFPGSGIPAHGWFLPSEKPAPLHSSHSFSVSLF